MFTSPMIGEVAAARRTDLIAAADAQRVARQGRQARNPGRNHGGSISGGRIRRTWRRTTTQPAHT